MEIQSSNGARDKKRLLFAGGHGGTVAVSIIEKLKHHKNWKLYWVGPTKANEAGTISSLEDKTLRNYGVAFVPISTDRLQKKLTRHTLSALLKIPGGFFQALRILRQVRPQLVFSFGGFAAIPIIFWAHFFKITIIIHDQTAIGLGLANKLSAPFASRILLAQKNTQIEKKYGSKVDVVGNPVRESIMAVVPKKQPSAIPTLFVFTGSRGSQIINKVLDDALETLLAHYTLIHLTGDLDYSYFKSRKADLPNRLSRRYSIFSFINPNEVYKYYTLADIIIARGGANTISEIQVVGRPAILIPLPILNYREQETNAWLAQKAGFAKVILRDNLTSASLQTAIKEVCVNWHRMANSAKETRVTTKSAEKIVTYIENEIA